jgi:amino acid permease
MSKATMTKQDGTISGADEVPAVELGQSVDLGHVVEYTNEKPAGESHQLKRTFTARHIQMIGLGGSIGSGIFIGTGKVLALDRSPD